MNRYVYKTRGTCSRQIAFSLEGDILHDVVFTFGCSGNTQGVARLVEGLSADKVIALLKDIDCNGRGTSCPAQLAAALKQVQDGTLLPVEAS